jgi:hypothetical protein
VRSCNRQLLYLTLALLGSVWHASPVRAQGHQTRRVALSWTLGGAIGGPSGDLERAMQTGGFGDDSGCWLFCTGSVSHPFTRASGGTSTLALGYAVKPWLDLRVQSTASGLGETFGYHAATDAYVFLRQSVTTVATLAMVSAGGTWWVGAGPSVNAVAIDRTDAPGGPAFRTTRLGVVVALDVTTPAHSLFFFDVMAQYHYVGAPSVGPFSSTGFLAAGATTMPPVNASFNHAVIALGLGIRL